MLRYRETEQHYTSIFTSAVLGLLPVFFFYFSISYVAFKRPAASISEDAVGFHESGYHFRSRQIYPMP